MVKCCVNCSGYKEIETSEPVYLRGEKGLKVQKLQIQCFHAQPHKEELTCQNKVHDCILGTGIAICQEI